MIFTPAVRENVGLWINLIGGTGSGKTYTAMRLASGICGGKPFALIDTENRRGLHYADAFKFDHAELRAPFRPDAYAEAVVAADKAGYPVIVIDSGSHVWSGDGGVLDWHEEELDALVDRAHARKDKRTDWQIREAGGQSAWIKPKMSHKRMVSKLLQVRAHIILCLRAEEKIEQVKEKDEHGKMKTIFRAKQSLTGLDGWIPLCEKALPFEATCSFLLTAARPGIPLPIKLQEQHKHLFPLNEPIGEESGKRLAQWASGATKAPPKGEQGQPTGATSAVTADSPSAGALITDDEAIALDARCSENGIDVAKLKSAAKVERLSMITAEALPRAHAWIDAVLKKREAA